MSEDTTLYIGIGLIIGCLSNFLFLPLIFGLKIFGDNAFNMSIFLFMLSLTLLGGVIGYFIDCLANKEKGFKKILITLGIITGITSIILFFVDYDYNWLYLVIFVLIITELIFWFDDEKPTKKENKLFFTTKIKSICLGMATLGVIITIGLSNLINRLIKLLSIYWQTILKWIGYIGVGILGIAIIWGIVYIYLLLNSLKYKNK